MRYVPHEYQKYAIDKLLKCDSAGLFLDMGLGKTVISLTVVNELLYNYFDISNVLVIAPLRVAQTTWPDEVRKWDHLQHLTISKILGSVKERRAALNTPADIHIINRENVVWLVEEYGKKWPFDMVIIDELSSFKSTKAKRFRPYARLGR